MHARAAARALMGLRVARTSAWLALPLQVSAASPSPAAALAFPPQEDIWKSLRSDLRKEYNVFFSLEASQQTSKKQEINVKIINLIDYS
ncbi:unnamed protein product [Sphenostylis stenocarpa]|uniref:Uncharacterized protein n=1 Tax=Sphenostylis stenocarpa TaxID=92480 RepID=A0AA86VRA5_9FABA|nr:unnamed protein product [Sphenostylis stenocarpa]